MSSPCPHGFDLLGPVRLFDGEEHEVRAWAVDAISGPTELASSPATVTCAPLALEGVRRSASEAAIAAWGLDVGWDQLLVSSAQLEALEQGDALGLDAALVTDAERSRLWLLDEGRLRAVTDAATAKAWRLEAATAEPWTEAELAAAPLGPPLRPRPVLLSTSGVAGSWDLLDEPVSTDGPGPVHPIPGGDPNQGGLVGSNDGCDCRIIAASPRRPSHGPRAALLAALGAVAIARLARRRRG